MPSAALTIASEFHQAHKDDKLSILEPNTKVPGQTPFCTPAVFPQISLALGSNIDDSITDAAERMKRWASEQWYVT